MLKEAMKYFADHIRPEELIVDEKSYIKKGEYVPALEQHPEPLKANTLSSIVDFCENKIDGWGNDVPLYIHIESHDKVSLKTKVVGEFNQRVVLVETEAITTDFQFKHGYEVESFIIALNSQFAPGGDRDYLLKLVSGMTKDESQKMSDNGVSQTVVTKSGARFLEETKIKNPVALYPYRTFSEIIQPESMFVFRISDGDTVKCSLHPCDGAAWRLEAIDNIKEFFKETLDIPVIA